MEHTIMDSLGLTVVAMSLVVLILSGLMFLMQVTAKLVNKPNLVVKESSLKDSKTTQPTVIQSNAKLERVAVLAALIETSENESGKHYTIEKVVRVK